MKAPSRRGEAAARCRPRQRQAATFWRQSGAENFVEGAPTLRGAARSCAELAQELAQRRCGRSSAVLARLQPDRVRVGAAEAVRPAPRPENERRSASRRKTSSLSRHATSLPRLVRELRLSRSNQLFPGVNAVDRWSARLREREDGYFFFVAMRRVYASAAERPTWPSTSIWIRRELLAVAVDEVTTRLPIVIAPTKTWLGSERRRPGTGRATSGRSPTHQQRSRNVGASHQRRCASAARSRSIGAGAHRSAVSLLQREPAKLGSG